MKRLFAVLFVFGVLFAALGNAYAINYAFDALKYPGALKTHAMDINDSGSIVGYYERTPDDPSDGRFYLGFLLKGSTWTTLDLSDTRESTLPNGINNYDWIVGSKFHFDLYGFTWGFGHEEWLYACPGWDGFTVHFYDVNDAGLIIGACGSTFFGSDGMGGFSFDGTSYNMFTAPDGSHPIPVDINNQGIIIATSENSSYYINGDTWYTLSYPGATSTSVTAINNLGVIVGQYTDSYGKIRAFRYNGTSWTSGNYPGAIETVASDINDKGVVIGTYRDENGESHGYSFVNGVWSRVDYPGATRTTANLINNNGWIVGSFTKDGQEGQFLAKPITTVKIDIKPNNSSNYINYRDTGTVSVAVLGSYSFRPFNVLDRTSLTFGRTGDESSLSSCSTTRYDVNHDGYADMVCGFSIPRTGFTCGDTSGTLKGKKTDGNPIEGKSYVRIKGCK